MIDSYGEKDIDHVVRLVERPSTQSYKMGKELFKSCDIQIITQNHVYNYYKYNFKDQQLIANLTDNRLG